MNDRNGFEDEKATDSEDFGALLDAYGGDFGGSVQVGDKINEEIIAIGADTVFVDTGTKIDGVVDKKELLDDMGQLPYGIGDRVELFIIAAEEGEYPAFPGTVGYRRPAAVDGCFSQPHSGRGSGD